MELCQPAPLACQGYSFNLSGQSLGGSKRGQVEETPTDLSWGRGWGLVLLDGHRVSLQSSLGQPEGCPVF